MNEMLAGLLAALVATNPPAAVSNLVKHHTGVAVAVPNSDDPVEKEYRKLMEEDDAAQDAAEKIIRDADAFAAQGDTTSKMNLSLRLEQHFKPTRDAYVDFLRRHPEHARARLAYGSFLNDLGEEEEAREQWEKARETDPKLPAAWNNLANHYGHRGPVKKAFEYYAKAMELAPTEPTYPWNLATTVYLFRKDAMEHYRLTEPEVFDRALALYRQALRLAPENFELAADLAQTFYGIKPLRIDEALAAWQDAIKIAKDDEQRQGVYVHFARLEMNSGRFTQAREHLNQITLPTYTQMRSRLEKNLAEREAKAAGTNAAPAPAPSPPPKTEER